MRTGRPATLRPAILLALASSRNPIGMSSPELADAVNWKPATLKQTLYRMVCDGRVFSLGAQKDTRYFGSAERREACRAAFDAHMAVVYAERKRVSIEGNRRRERERSEREKAMRPAQAGKPKKPSQPKAIKKNSARKALLEMIRAFDDSLGMSLEDLKARGVDAGSSTFKSLDILIGRGLVFDHGIRHWRRLFADQAKRDAAVPILTRMQAENAARLRRIQDEKKNAKQIAARRAKPKQPKPAKAVPVKQARQVFLRPSVKQPTKAKFNNLPVVNPNNVKPTICPPFVPRTFAPPPFFKGEFEREWHEKRSQREAA
jgi:hypothetical protein